MNTAKRALIVGAEGQLAQALAASAPLGTECVRFDHARLDICDAPAITAALEAVQPTLLINGAAYNMVDKAEGEGMEAALRVNALGVGRLAEACRQRSIPLVHFSTDLVFDGQKRTPYTEDDLARPLNVYGASKLAGENMALSASPHNFVVRVERLFGPSSQPAQGSAAKPSSNFPLLMLRLAQQKGEVRVVDDQVGSPTYLPDLAQSVWQLVENAPGGLYQLSNSGEVSFSDYTREIFRLAGVACVVHSVSSASYGAAAHRPAYSVLSNAKAQAAGLPPLRGWQEALAAFLTTRD